jgi:hypothetical protein
MMNRRPQLELDVQLVAFDQQGDELVSANFGGGARFTAEVRERVRQWWSELAPLDLGAVTIEIAGARCGSSMQPVPPRESYDEVEAIGPKSCGIWTPAIASLRGVISGDAFELIGEADRVLAAASMEFVEEFVHEGRISASAASLLARLPIGEIFRLALSGGAPLGAHRALQVGLVDSVASDDDVTHDARRAASAIARDPLLAEAELLRWEHRGFGPRRASDPPQT